MKNVLSVLLILLLLIPTALFAAGASETTEGMLLNEDGKQFTIGMIDYPQFQPYKVRTAAAKQAAEEYGVKYVLFQPTEVTIDSYVETVINVINQDFDALIFEPWVPDAFKEAFDLAYEKGIPVVTPHVGPVPEQKHKVISELLVDNTAYGITAAAKIDESVDGQANVLIIMNNPDVANQMTIRNSFEAEIKANYPNIKLTATEFSQVDPLILAERMEAALRAYPEINVVMFLEAATVMKGADVAREMGRLEDIMIIGIDDPPDMIESIRKGEVWGSFNQNFQKQGYESVRNIVDNFLGNPFPKYTDVGIVLINQDNIDDYISSMWEPVALKGKPYPNL
jgi:ribose transport system substrate-binding protein